MDRRGFIKAMAAFAAGASVYKAAAMEKLYANAVELDIPPVTNTDWATDILQIEDWLVGFDNAPADNVISIGLFRDDGVSTPRPLLQVALNQRATFRWVRGPMTPVVCHRDHLKWVMESPFYHEDAENPRPIFPNSQLMLTNASGQLYNMHITSAKGWVKDHLGDAGPLEWEI